MKNLFALTLLALGLAFGIAANVNSASAKTLFEEVFEPRGP